eukprot:CAMPEP_0170085114 /NCGR_PEP_ID=MMETSP0019_2-20121128/20090_1 /TAXON_ID=98059 /ORGANISM="Dinobryon sp., Strain UTEXLB2267" /LENGTH=795 /DNA_ID=CAMNT_0010301437 /DNA_START=383 /DNA_END=2770 /DNA_ORIENTATION=+
MIHHSVTPRGAVLYGSLCNPCVIQRALQTSGYPVLPPAEIALTDSRAHKLLVTHCASPSSGGSASDASGGWYAIPYPETFSRHSGSCLILGDRNVNCTPFPIKTGDCFRLGSVGLVVSEMRQGGEGCEEVRMDARTLQFLKDESVAFETQEYMAALAADERERETECLPDDLGRSSSLDRPDCSSPESMDAASPGESRCRSDSSNVGPTSWVNTDKDRSGIANGERFICYMCYETHNTIEDSLVAPCECKGDTRYLHVQCLQKWYHSSMSGAQTQVIRTTGNGAPACKICGAAYKTTFRRSDGKKASLLEMESNGPYLSLVVVTRHDTNPGLFNTKFRLNFGRSANPNNSTQTEEEANSIIIGRSSTCNMILDYRTVSTVHAKIHFHDGKFFLSDKRSSNGTMIYLQDPVHLPYMVPMKFRMGRTTLTLQAKRSWTSAMRGVFGGSVATHSDGLPYPTASDVFNVLLDASNNTNKADPQTSSNILESDGQALSRSMSLRTMNDGGSVDGANDAEHHNTHDEDNDPLEFATHSPSQPQHGHQLHHHQHHGRAARNSPFSSGRHLPIAHRVNASPLQGGMMPLDGLAVHRELAAATRDLDMDDDELQQAIQQSLQQRDRRPASGERAGGGEGSAGEGAGRWVEAADEAAVTSESADLNLHLHDGMGSFHRPSSRGARATVGNSTIMDGSSSVPPSRSRAASYDLNHHLQSHANTSIFADEVLSLPAAGAFGMPSNSSNSSSLGGNRIMLHSESSPTHLSESDKARERRNSPGAIVLARGCAEGSPGRTSTIYAGDDV